MSNRLSAIAAAMLAPALMLGAMSGASAQTRNCADTLAAMPEFSRFTSGVVASHLVGDFRTANGITIFAPTNDALANMSRLLVDRLFPMQDGGRQADMTAAPAAVGAHVLQGRRDAASLAQGGQFTSAASTPLTVTAAGGVITVAGAGDTKARVTQADIACSNGVIHAIDGLLVR